MTTSKSAAVFALDVSCAETLSKGVALCEATALDKLVYAPHDELGLVLSGTDSSANPLHVDTNGQRYAHITVARTVAPTTAEFLAPLKKAVVQGTQNGSCDMLETIIVCAQLLHVRTANKKYARTIYLITDCRQEVAHKDEITTVLESLQAESVSLVVVGIDFTEESVSLSGEDWSRLPTKAQNERVLHFLCGQLGEGSLIVTPDEALDGVHLLRRRSILQRPLLKVSLAIGTIRIATQMFTKASKQVQPSMPRVRIETGEPVSTAYTYVRAVGAAPNAAGSSDETAAHSGGDGVAGGVVEWDQRIKAYYYGRTLIPCTEADLEVMRIAGQRSLEVLGFVPLKDVPPYILMGGTKAILPLAGDLDGQRGFSSFVQAMEAEGVAAVTRFVRTKDAAPALALCVPSHKRGKRDALYFAPLPFAEDARLFRFSELEDVRCTSAEEALVDDLVDAMTVEKQVLRPSDTFNPVLAMHYATLKAKVLRAAHDTADGTGTNTSPAEFIAATKSDVPPLLPQLSATSTDFTNYANPISRVMQDAAPMLETCAGAFPYVEAATDADGKHARAYWFRLAANVHDGTAAEATDAQSSASAPTTLNAFHLLQQQQQNRKGDDADEAESTTSVSTSAAVATMAGHVLEASVTRISTINPAQSFRTLAEQTRAMTDGADVKDVLAAQESLMDALTEIILRLLRGSFKDDHYQKCDEGVQALRAFCVEESMPQYYNRFLIQLMVTSRECGHGETYWQPHVASCKPLGPITQAECPSSALKDEAAAHAFLSHDRAQPEIPVEDEPEDDLLDLIS